MMEPKVVDDNRCGYSESADSSRTMDGSAVHYVDESAIAACIPYGHMHEAHVLE